MSYACNAEMYCAHCADMIKAKLDAAGHEDSGDTNEYPQYSYGDESDTPQNCADCTKFLENNLTSDGMAYVQNAVNEDTESGATDSLACMEWGPFYGISYQPSIEDALEILAKSIATDDSVAWAALDILIGELE